MAGACQNLREWLCLLNSDWPLKVQNQKHSWATHWGEGLVCCVSIKPGLCSLWSAKAVASKSKVHSPLHDQSRCGYPERKENWLKANKLQQTRTRQTNTRLTRNIEPSGRNIQAGCTGFKRRIARSQRGLRSAISDPWKVLPLKMALVPCSDVATHIKRSDVLITIKDFNFLMGGESTIPWKAPPGACSYSDSQIPKGRWRPNFWIRNMLLGMSPDARPSLWAPPKR